MRAWAASLLLLLAPDLPHAQETGTDGGGWRIGARRSPHEREIKPGRLSPADKRKSFREFSRRQKAEKKEKRKALLLKRAERMKELEEEFGIYDVATLVDQGDVSKRVDIVIVSCGFPKAQAKRVKGIVEQLRKSFGRIDPFRNYPAYVNFHLVLVDDPNLDEARIETKIEKKILTCDRKAAVGYAQHAPDADLVVLLCNVSGVRSTGGGGVITMKSSLDVGRTFLHEMGHAFAGVRDEYVDKTSAEERKLFTAKQEASNPMRYINVTRESDPKKVKWHYWIPPVWFAAQKVNRIPKGHKVGCFEGGEYRAKNVWRPERECLMRQGMKYCVVCFEHVERRFYRLIAPIDKASPRRAAVGLWAKERKTFEAQAITTATSGRKQIGSFRGVWFVDGKKRSAKAKGLKTSLTLSARELGTGRHEVGLRVDFSNKRIRRDYGWLSSSRGWIVDVSPHARPVFKAPNKVEGKIGEEIAFQVKIKNSGSFRLEALDLPVGAGFKEGRFTWTPKKVHQGAWRPRFVLSDDLRRVETAVEISVLDPDERNYRPFVFLPDVQSVREGAKLECALEVVDLDGDNLVFRSSNLPEGAELGAADGTLHWKPGASQAGRYEVDIEITDGRYRTSVKLEIEVEDGSIRGGSDFDVLQMLRSPKSRDRKWALEQLDKLAKEGKYARTFLFQEAARLLRDWIPSVRKAALNTLKSLEARVDEPFLDMMLQDLAPHAWHFTDNPEILAWLTQLADRVPKTSHAAKYLRTALKRIEMYNKGRGIEE